MRSVDIVHQLSGMSYLSVEFKVWILQSARKRGVYNKDLETDVVEHTEIQSKDGGVSRFSDCCCCDSDKINCLFSRFLT